MSVSQKCLKMIVFSRIMIDFHSRRHFTDYRMVTFSESNDSIVIVSYSLNIAFKPINSSAKHARKRGARFVPLKTLQFESI